MYIIAKRLFIFSHTSNFISKKKKSISFHILLISIRDSLVYRVLKAKYFPTSDFVHASIGHNPSYTWRSLISAQSLVIEGMRWRVGNGANIKIWQDKCLPGVSSHKVLVKRIAHVFHIFLCRDKYGYILVQREGSRS